jgi:GNAT superfamily N-acetyltransferase
MTIRPLVPSDFDRVLSMMVTFYASDALLVHPEESVLRKTLTDALSETPYLEAFGFEADGQLAGYGMVATSYSTEAGGLCAWIEDIYIEPEHRGKGYGSSFLEFVRQRYRNRVARIRGAKAATTSGSTTTFFSGSGVFTCSVGLTGAAPCSSNAG